jgi:2-iminobutanoate/2-iminopropanoate deaminase
LTHHPEKEKDMPYVNIKVTGGKEAPSEKQKAELIKGVTKVLVDVLGKNPATTVVVIDEVELDNWGIGGESITERRKNSLNSDAGENFFINYPKIVATDKSPDAVGAYSQALRVGNFVFTSGQLPMEPLSKSMPVDIKEQTALALTNVKNILEAAGSGLDKVVKMTIYLADINDFSAMNEVYAVFFQKPFPARSCFAVKSLPMEAKVEIEAIAVL